MNVTPLLLICIAILIAFVDWWSVATGRASIEALAKPLVMVALILAASVSDQPDTVRWLIIGGLVFGLVGDVLLLPRLDNFIGGLAAFLVGHALYVAAFVAIGSSAPVLLVGLATAGLIGWFIGRPIVAAVKETKLAIPVLLYFLTISAMVVTGIGTGVSQIAAGALIFALSDGLLGTDRFVDERSDRRAWVHVLYHLGQIGIVAGIA